MTIKSTFTKTLKAKATNAIYYVLPTLLMSPLTANAGLEKVEKGLNTVQTWLLSIAGVALTIAMLIVGIGVMYMGRTYEELKKPIMGALIVAAATGVPAWFF